MQKDTKGSVVFVNVYDNNYWNVFLDGKLIDEIRKNSFSSYIFKISNQKRLAKLAGVSVSCLTYSMIDLEGSLDSLIDYNSNDYEDFKDVIDACNQYHIDYSFKDVKLEYIEAYF